MANKPIQIRSTPEYNQKVEATWRAGGWRNASQMIRDLIDREAERQADARE